MPTNDGVDVLTFDWKDLTFKQVRSILHPNNTLKHTQHNKKHLISLTVLYCLFLRKDETQKSIYDASETLWKHVMPKTTVTVFISGSSFCKFMLVLPQIQLQQYSFCFNWYIYNSPTVVIFSVFSITSLQYVDTTQSTINMSVLDSHLRMPNFPQVFPESLTSNKHIVTVAQCGNI